MPFLFLKKAFFRELKGRMGPKQIVCPEVNMRKTQKISPSSILSIASFGYLYATVHVSGKNG